MDISFLGNTSQNIFGEMLNYSIVTATDGIQIIDDFGGKTGHQMTRIRMPIPGRHFYVKQYKPWNQVILCKRKEDKKITDEEVNYKGYIIKPKRDFGRDGFLINGKTVKKGFVVTDNHNINVMPGATWFQTIEEAEKGVDERLKKLKLERNEVMKPYDAEIHKVQRTLVNGYQELRTLKHNREIWIRNQELQKNKDLFSKGMNFEDLILVGTDRFSDFKYFLKSGTEVTPRLHVYVEGIDSEEELRAKAEELLSKEEMEHLSRAFWGRYLEFTLDFPVEAFRRLYRAGFKLKSYSSADEYIELRETNETLNKRKARTTHSSEYPLSYTRKPETITVVRQEACNDS